MDGGKVMKTFSISRWNIFVMMSLFILLLGVSAASAQNTMKAGGKNMYVYLDRPTFEFDDAEGHTIYISKWEGLNRSTGEVEFLDDAVVKFLSYGDYIKGNGPFWGYIKMMKDGETVYSEFKGEAKTSLSEEGKPMMHLSGTIKMIRGTGQYKGIRGSGTFNNEMVSDRMMIGEWKGEYTIEN